MEIEKLSDDLGITGQVRPRDLPLIHALGYRSVICNRPDGEEEDQPLFASVEKAAHQSGIAARYLPLAPSGADEDQLRAFARAWAKLKKPVLLYCRTGGRSKRLAQEALAL